VSKKLILFNQRPTTNYWARKSVALQCFHASFVYCYGSGNHKIWVCTAAKNVRTTRIKRQWLVMCYKIVFGLTCLKMSDISFLVLFVSHVDILINCLFLAQLSTPENTTFVYVLLSHAVLRLISAHWDDLDVFLDELTCRSI